MSNQITYKPSPYASHTRVYSGNRRIGTIMPSPDTEGFRYFPVGSPKHRGEAMATVEQVKRSIEG